MELAQAAHVKYGGLNLKGGTECDYWREAFCAADEVATYTRDIPASLVEGRMENLAVKAAEHTERLHWLSQIGEQVVRCRRWLDGSVKGDMPLADALKTLGRLTELQQRLVALAQKGGA